MKSSDSSKDRQFALPWNASFGTVDRVRMVVGLIILFACGADLLAQEQEGKLIDRLLKPNLSLTNSAQNKQFSAPNVIIPKQVQTKATTMTDRLSPKSFDNTRALSPGEFAVRHFRLGESRAAVAARSKSIDVDTVQPASVAYSNRVAPESSKSIQTADFADAHPFSGQGKSQNALRAFDRPLTIEQVRELLNKNK